jgi:hypothetical protein
MTDVHDAIITKTGQVIRTDPDDNIYAKKGGMGGTVNMNFGNFTFNVTEGNARNAGQNFIGGMEQQIRKMLVNNLVNTGGH